MRVQMNVIGLECCNLFKLYGASILQQLDDHAGARRATSARG
jgi:hypothetical protein